MLSAERERVRAAVQSAVLATSYSSLSEMADAITAAVEEALGPQCTCELADQVIAGRRFGCPVHEGPLYRFGGR